MPHHIRQNTQCLERQIVLQAPSIVSICVIAICRYIFVSPPLTPFLNTAFIKLDGVFPLFGTAFFALFCFYLLGALPL